MKMTLLPEVGAEADADADAAEHHDELARIAERVLEVPQPDTPRLDIHPVGCQVSITWQAGEETFRLEVSERAYASGDWQPVEADAQCSGGVHRVLLPGAAHVRFVRLARRRNLRRGLAIPTLGRAHGELPPVRSAGRRPDADSRRQGKSLVNPDMGLPAYLARVGVWMFVAAAGLALVRHLVMAQ